jgi:hypothetical protein
VNLPSPIQTYFHADTQCDGEALIRTFAPDAVVKDEGKAHAGRQAIDAWWREVKSRYRHAIEPLAAGNTEDVISVRAKVTGQFPGSPAVLTFTFRLEGSEITRLEIGA